MQQLYLTPDDVPVDEMTAEEAHTFWEAVLQIHPGGPTDPETILHAAVSAYGLMAREADRLRTHAEVCEVFLPFLNGELDAHAYTYPHALAAVRHLGMYRQQARAGRYTSPISPVDAAAIDAMLQVQAPAAKAGNKAVSSLPKGVKAGLLQRVQAFDDAAGNNKGELEITVSGGMIQLAQPGRDDQKNQAALAMGRRLVHAFADLCAEVVRLAPTAHYLDALGKCGFISTLRATLGNICNNQLSKQMRENLARLLEE